MKRFKKNSFSMVEVIAMFAVTAILLAAFSATLNGVFRANETFVEESKALLIMENSVERLKNREKVSAEEFKTLLHDEFRRSDLGKNKLLFAIVSEKDGEKYIFSIIREKDHRVLAKVKW